LERVDASPAQEVFMRTIVLMAAMLAALPLTSIRAHADGAWWIVLAIPTG
jgi:hypothetical protein